MQLDHEDAYRAWSCGQLDAATGLPLPGQGYGKHLMGGNHARVEGAYILFSPTSKYYYLFTSFGGLDAVGGYNVRVARSLQPDGPYLDGAGTSMVALSDSSVSRPWSFFTVSPGATRISITGTLA